MKVVINCCFGGYGLSQEAYAEMGMKWDDFGYAFNDDRTNPLLIAAVEKLGEAANGAHAELKVVEVPDGIYWHIDEYDGNEHIAENHRIWR